MTTGKKVDGLLYKDWSTRWQGHADAVAGLDDIKGDWKRSLRNYELYGGFPTIHDSDPPELLKDLIPIARNRGGWLGIGLVPPRHGKEMFIHSVCDAVPDDIHIHGWALRAYAHIRRLDSVDSTNWWRDGMTINKMLPWLHYGECLDIVIKRYLREKRNVSDTDQSSLFED